MPGQTDYLGIPYPLPGEVFTRQHIEDLAEDLHFYTGANHDARDVVTERIRGMLGHSGNNVFTNGAVGYMSWNVDHLAGWSTGGAAIASTQGPTLSQGLYLFTFIGQVTSWSAVYSKTHVEFERGGTRVARRTLSFSQRSWRISAPVRVPAGAPQQVRARIQPDGPTPGSTFTIARTFAEATPRMAWVLLSDD